MINRTIDFYAHLNPHCTGIRFYFAPLIYLPITSNPPWVEAAERAYNTESDGVKYHLSLSDSARRVERSVSDVSP